MISPGSLAEALSPSTPSRLACTPLLSLSEVPPSLAPPPPVPESLVLDDSRLSLERLPPACAPEPCPTPRTSSTCAARSTYARSHSAALRSTSELPRRPRCGAPFFLPEHLPEHPPEHPLEHPPPLFPAPSEPVRLMQTWHLATAGVPGTRTLRLSLSLSLSLSRARAREMGESDVCVSLASVSRLSSRVSLCRVS